MTKLEINHTHSMYKVYKQKALLLSEKLRPKRSVPIIVHAWIHFDANQVVQSELGGLKWTSDRNNRWIRILVPASLDTGSDADIADTAFFKIFRETATRHIKITGLYGDSQKEVNKHRLVNGHMKGAGLVEIIECETLPQLKFSTEVREAAALQLGVERSGEDLLGIFDERKVLV